MPTLAGAHLSPVKIVARYIPYSITLAGIRWSADWSIEGDEISIRSAYGSASRKLGRRRPDLLARELLMEILRAKLAKADSRP